MGFRIFSVTALIWFVIFIISPVHSADSIDDIMQDTIDSMVQDLADKYWTDFDSNTFWHPYVYGTGNENREVIHVEEVKKEFIDGNYLQWKYARLGLKHYIVGQSLHSIDLFGSDFQKITSVESIDDLEALAVYTRWNDEHFHPELIMLAATSEPRLMVYQLENDVFENIGSFPLHYAVQGMELCHVGSSEKVLIIPKENVEMDIYNVEVSNSSQVWFFQRLSEAGNPNVVVFDSDLLESVIAVPRDSKVDIFTFDTKAGLFNIYQSINIPRPCRRLFSFTLAYQHYIGCIPEERDLPVLFISYNYNTNEFVMESDTLGNIHADEIYPVAVADYRDEYLLIVQDNEGLTSILSYHGRQIGFEVEYTCKITDDCPPIVELNRGIAFRQNEHTAYVFPSGQGSDNSEVLLIKKQIRDSVSPLVAESRNLYNTFQELSRSFENWERGVIGVQKRLEKQIQIDQPNIISGSWDVDSISASHAQFKAETYENTLISNFTVPQADVINVFNFMGATWTDQDFSVDHSLAKTELNSLHDHIVSAKTQLSDAVFENSEGTQVVTASQEVSGTFDSKTLSIRSIDASTIQDYRSTTEFLNSLAKKLTTLHIRSHIVFDRPLRLSKLNAGDINGVIVSEIGRLSHENIFNCSIQFVTPLNVNGNVSTTTVNGVEIAKELIYPMNISSLNFLDGFVVNNNTRTSGRYDFQKVLRRSSEQVVSSHVIFAHIKALTPITIGLINGYSLSEFASSVISEDYTGQIYGTKIVSEKVDADSLNITSSWNFLSFPNFFVHNAQKRVVIHDSKNFTYITADKVTVVKQLDGLDPNSLVELSSSMDIRSKWTFVGDAVIVNDIDVSENGTVDGVHMNELKSSGTLDEYKESYVAVADVEFEQEVIFDKLSVNSKINGNEFDDAFGNLLLFNGSHCKVAGLTTIDSNLILDSIKIDSEVINSYDLKSFFNVGDEQNITGNFRLINECQFNSLYSLERYDTVDLRGLLLHAVRLTGINKIAWKTHFDHIKCGAGMVADGPINEFADFGKSIGVTSGREFQSFLSDLLFYNATFGNLDVEEDVQLPYEAKIGGIDVVSWNSRRLSLSKDERFDYRFEIEGLVKASHDVFTEAINDILLSILSDSTFRTDSQSQTFTEFVIIQNNIELLNGRLVFEDEISGYSLNDLVKFAFPLNSSDEGWLQLRGSWHFDSIIVSESVTVEGKTCSVDLKNLDANSVRKGESNVQIWGENTFNSIEVQNSITAEFVNNNMNFDNLFTLRGTQSIQCPFHFMKDVIVDGNLETNGQLNNVSIASLVSAYSQDDHNVHIVRGDFLSEYNMTMESLKVGGLIQGTSLQAHISSLLKTGDSDLQFSGLKHFTNSIIIGGDAEIKLYNSIQPSELNLLRLDSDIAFDYPVAFKDLFKSDAIDSSVENVDPKHIVGIDWEDLIRNTIPINRISNYDHLTKLPFDKILVKNFLNTRIFQSKMFREYITLNADQIIDRLQIEDAEFFGSDVPVSGLVSGFNLPNEFDNMLMGNLNPASGVEGNKVFKGSIIVNGDFNCFGPQLKEDVIDISKDFDISSPIEFSKPLFVDGAVNVTEPVHGHTIDSIVSEALTQEDDQSITGEWDFLGGVTFKDDVTGTGELHNFDLQSLIDKKNIEIQEAEQRISKEKQIFQEKCYDVYNLTAELTSNPMKLDAFDKHQSIILRNQVEKMITVTAAEKLYLLTASSTCEIVKYEWKASTELFYKDIDMEQNQLRLGLVKDWESTSHGSTGILVFSTQTSDCSSPLETGIHALVLKPVGGFSAPNTLHSGDFNAFKLVSDVEGTKTAIFVLKNDGIQIIVWNEEETRFAAENLIPLSGSYNGIELTPFRNDIAVLLRSEALLTIFHYSWTKKSLVLTGSNSFLTDKGASLTLFGNYDDLYAIVQNMNQLSGTVQILKTSDREMNLVQHLVVQDLESQSVIEFSSQTYVVFLSKSFGLSIYQLMGLNRLQLLNDNPIKVFNGIQVYSFDVKPWHYSATRPFLLILTSKTIEVYHSNVYGDSLNLNSKNLCRVS